MQRTCIKIAILLVTLAIFSFKLSAQSNCQCNSYFDLGPDANCRLILTKEKLGLKNCPDSYLVVFDLNPKNRDTIDAAGGYDYGLYAQNGNLLCRGFVNAYVIGAPGLDSTDFVQDTLAFIDLGAIDYTTVGSTKNFASPKVNIYRLTVGANGKYSQLEFAPDTVPNFGIPYFSPRCQPNNCAITVQYYQTIDYPACADALRLNLYATIKRVWTATDCDNRSTVVQQTTAIRRPNREDFHWSASILKTREITLNYGNCTLDAKNLPLQAITPALGKNNISFTTGPILGYQTSVKNQIDTVCNGAGLSYQHNYYIKEECANRVIDSFKLNLIPGTNTSNWLSSSTPVINLALAKDSCYFYISNQLDSIVKKLKLTLSPVCPIQFIKWQFEYPDTFSLQRYNLESWIPVSLFNNKIRLYGGKLRVRFTMIDACNNLCTKTITIDLRSYEPLNVICIEPFVANLTNKYFRAQYRFVRPDPLRQTCGSIAYVRRAVSPQCLKFFLNATYDTDQDQDYLEHFELIKTGPYAGHYLTPWDHFVEAFECDLGQTVYLEGKVYAFDGRSKICSSYFYVTNQVSNKAKIAVGKETTALNRQICVPVNIDPFIHIIGWQFAVKFDPTILKLDSVRAPNPAFKKMLVGYPGTGNNPADRAILLWVYDGTNTVSLPNRSPLVELCFSPLKTGISKVWIDTTLLTEFIGQYDNPYAIHTISGAVEVLNKNEIVNRLEESRTEGQALTDKVRPNIKVFPNPGSDQVQVLLPAAWLPQGEILLKDLQGRILLRKAISAALTALDIAALPRGVILVEVHHGKQIWMERLVLIQP